MHKHKSVCSSQSQDDQDFGVSLDLDSELGVDPAIEQGMLRFHIAFHFTSWLVIVVPSLAYFYLLCALLYYPCC